MKVKCINKLGWEIRNRKFLFFNLKNKRVIGPKFGDILTVVGSSWDMGEEFYDLKEWPESEGGYESSQFEPLEEKYEEVKFKEIKEKASVN